MKIFQILENDENQNEKTRKKKLREKRKILTLIRKSSRAKVKGRKPNFRTSQNLLPRKQLPRTRSLQILQLLRKHRLARRRKNPHGRLACRRPKLDS